MKGMKKPPTTLSLRVWHLASLSIMATCLGMAQVNYEHVVVPALSNIKRLADTPPTDGVPGGTVELLAAKGEYEPASFLLRSQQSVKQVVLKASPLKGKHGTIPAEAIDLKVVKIWVQTGCAWYSYFADATGRQLVPELLLNDETLVEVDSQTLDNYLRVTDPKGREQRVWISHPREINYEFNPWRDRVADARTLQPFTLEANSYKQIWLTFHAPKQAEGVYSGTIEVTLDGRPAAAIPLKVRVLPFELPQPRTNYDLERPFYASTYNNSSLQSYVKAGATLADAEKYLYNEYVNFRDHNLLYPMVPTFRGGNTNHFVRQLQIYKAAGLATDVVFDAVRGIPDYGYLRHTNREKPLAEQDIPNYWPDEIIGGRDIVHREFGPDTIIYCYGWDEPGMKLLRAQRAAWQFIHQQHGLRTFSTGHSRHLLHGGYNEDFVNYGGSYSKDDARTWHAMGALISSYANPHTGPENPDFARRTHGLDLYMADQDGTINYKLSGYQWNDFIGSHYNFRSFSWIYPGTEHPINTMAFEAYREALDDVRYATLLKQTANRVIAKGTTEHRYAGRIALQYLALLNTTECDLNTVRLEMIKHLLRLGEML